MFFDPRGDNDPINCLIIEADASTPRKKDTKVFLPNPPGKAPQGVELEELTHIKGKTGESRLLETYLKELKEKVPLGMIDKVTRLAKELLPENTTFTGWVYQVLKENPWHLVHYAGHSFVDDDGDGWVVFPRPQPSQPGENSDVTPLSVRCRQSQIYVYEQLSKLQG